MAHHISEAPTLEQNMVNYLRAQGADDRDILETCKEPVLCLNQQEVSRIFGLS